MVKTSSYFLLVISTLAFNLYVLQAEKTCAGQSDHQLNLASLYWSDYSYRGANDTVTFDLCQDSNTTVVIKLHNGTEIGTHYVNKSETEYGETLLRYNTTDGTETFIFFTCEMNTLGKPVWLDNDHKRFFFEWRTMLVCNLPPPLPLPQMPCYIYTSSQQLIDLTDLTRTDGSYHLDTDGGSGELMINICGKIAGTDGCDGPVCSKSDTDGSPVTVSAMDPTTKLTLNADSKLVQLRYKATDTGCDTLINFICPNSPRQATPPTVASKCSSDKTTPWTINWYTTHACPISHLVAHQSCQLTNSQYGVNIDLSPLSNDKKAFNVTVGEYLYEMGMCGTKVTGCPLSDKDDSRGDTVACQKKPQDPSYHKSIGMSEFTELRYIDDTLVMKLYKGEACRNKFQRETVIRFNCDNTAGIGAPVFDFESHCSYHFNWNTSYACDQSLPCTYQPDPSNSSNVYDFSSLTKLAGSASWSTKTDQTNLAYINVCHSVEDVDGCDPTAAVCLKPANSNKGSNLGRASTMKFDKSGQTVSLTYTDGDSCGDGKKHSTTIYFVCDTGSQLAGPQWNEEEMLACFHTIRWATPAACGNTPTQSGTCTVASRGFLYDFSSITSFGSDIKVSPCGPLSENCGSMSDATVCQGSTTLSKQVPKLVVENEQVVSAHYEPEAGKKSVSVRYNCDETKEVLAVTRTWTVGQTINIEVNTTLSCAPKAVDCRPTGDDGHIYDLRGLSGRNYLADSSDGMQYFFSVCSPLDKSINSVESCPGGAISACQVTTGEEHVNLGYAVSNPKVISTGLINFLYINGKTCGHGNKTPRQTKVVLNCQDIESKPYMKAENDDCDYEIWWDTPKACPLEKAEVNECVIIRDGVKYDLSPLSKTRSVSDGQGSTYYLTVCNRLVIADHDDVCQAAGVCKKTGSTYTNVGRSDSRKINPNGGNTRITYTIGEKKSEITLVCGKLRDGTVRFLRSGQEATYFEWETSLVCTPTDVECSGILGGKPYDLSSLIDSDRNYVGHNHKGDLFYFNICHRVIATGDAVNCPAGAAACMVTGSDSNKTYISLGHLDPTQPALNWLSTPIVQYKNGDVCASDPSKHYSTLIMFTCNHDQEVVGEVQVAMMSSDCRQDFIVETEAACPVEKATKQSSEVECEDIPGLNTDKLKTQYEIEADDHTYYLNFCGSLGTKTKTHCNGTSNFGVCQVSKNTKHEEVVAGLPTSKANLVNGRIIFNYADGAICKHDPNLSPRNVVLEMFCNQYAELDSSPMFQRETAADCTYYMYWQRPELCTTDKIVCSVNQNGHVIDLSSLSDETHFAQASSALREYQGKLYQISVCKPLAITHLNRCPGAAVCETDNSDLNNYKDLGFVGNDLLATGSQDNPEVRLVYNTTISCDIDESQTVSSIIIFSCGDTMGSPVLADTDSCTYTFTWQTSEACIVDHVAQTADCTVINPTNNKTIDLSSFKGNTYKVDGYSLRVCDSLPIGDLQGCPADTAACKDGQVSGQGSRMKPLRIHGDSILLTYDSTTACDKGGTRSTTIEFVCKPLAGKGEPVSKTGFFDSCDLSFRWETSYVCTPDCQLYNLGELYDFAHLTSHNGFYEVSASGYIFSINICKDLPVATASAEATCVSVVKDGKTIPLALTSTLVSTFIGKDNLTLEYMGTDSSLCSSGQTSRVRFELSCSNTLGQPIFVEEEPDTCTFVFQWSTYAACAEDSRSAVQLSDGQFTDPLSQLSYSVAALLNRRVNIQAGEYTYALSLNQALPDEESLRPHCVNGDAHVCQYKTKFNRNLGQEIQSSYYQDEQLQMVLNSDSVCGRNKKSHVQTIINFVCNDQVPEDSEPEFLDEMDSCRYLFEWHTPTICQPINASEPAKAPMSNRSVATIVGVVMAVLLAAALIVGIVVYKRKHRRRWDGVYEYSGISQDDDTTGLISANRGSAPRFYDDDDEDMII